MLRLLPDLALLNRGGDNGCGTTGGPANLARVRAKITEWLVQALVPWLTSQSKVQQPGLMKLGLRAAGTTPKQLPPHHGNVISRPARDGRA